MQQNKPWKWEVGTGEGEVLRIWKEYFEYLYNTDTREQDADHMCGFDGVRRCNLLFLKLCFSFTVDHFMA